MKQGMYSSCSRIPLWAFDGAQTHDWRHWPITSQTSYPLHYAATSSFLDVQLFTTVWLNI